MKAAIAIYGDNVAPRFGFADRFLIADIDGKKVVHSEEVFIEKRGWPWRLEAIRNLGVDTLLCCGFNRHYIPLCDTLGVRVITGLSGEGRALLEQFAEEKLPLTCCGKRGHGGAGRGGRGRGKGRGRRAGQSMSLKSSIESVG